MKVNKIKFQISLLVLIVYLLFNISYFLTISPLYGYMGFAFNPISSRVFIGFLIVLLNSAFLLRGSRNEFIYAAHVIFSIFYLFPNLILNSVISEHWDIVLSIMFFLLCLNLLGLVDFRIKFLKVNERSQLYWLTFITFLAIIPFIIIYGKSINFSNFLFEGSNETRMQSRELATTYTSYSYSWLAKILIPIGLVYALLKRKYILSIFFLVSVLFLFLTSAHKSVFIGLMSILFFYYGSTILIKIKYFLIILIGITLLSFLLNSMFEFHYIESLFIRRIFFLPALLNIHYFDFFRDINYFFLIVY